jgi:hypothetical protein
MGVHHRLLPRDRESDRSRQLANIQPPNMAGASPAHNRDPRATKVAGTLRVPSSAGSETHNPKQNKQNNGPASTYRQAPLTSRGSHHSGTWSAHPGARFVLFAARTDLN